MGWLKKRRMAGNGQFCKDCKHHIRSGLKSLDWCETPVESRVFDCVNGFGTVHAREICELNYATRYCRFERKYDAVDGEVV